MTARPDPEAVLKALFMAASHCQGGSSDAGRAIATLLNIAFPVRMQALSRRAIQFGFEPDELWPWLKTQMEIVRLSEVD